MKKMYTFDSQDVVNSYQPFIFVVGGIKHTALWRAISLMFLLLLPVNYMHGEMDLSKEMVLFTV